MATTNNEIRLLKVVEECKAELDKLNIEYASNITFKVNKRFKRCFGNCKRISKDKYVIEVSDVLLQPCMPTKELKNTIIHELLHTVKGGMCHTGTWKQCANRVNNAYDYDIQRCGSFEKLGIENTKEYKYKFVCDGCGQVIYRMKKSKFVTDTHRYRCSRCCSTFTRVR